MSPPRLGDAKSIWIWHQDLADWAAIIVSLSKNGGFACNIWFQEIFWMLVLYGHLDTPWLGKWKTTLVLPCFTPNHIGGIWWNKVDWQIQVSCWKLVGINQWSAKYQSSINIRSRKFHLHHLQTIRLLQTELCWWWRCSFVITWSALWNVLHGIFFYFRSTWSKSKYNAGRVDDQYKSPTWPLSQVGSHFWKQYNTYIYIYV